MAARRMPCTVTRGFSKEEHSLLTHGISLQSCALENARSNVNRRPKRRQPTSEIQANKATPLMGIACCHSPQLGDALVTARVHVTRSGATYTWFQSMCNSSACTPQRGAACLGFGVCPLPTNLQTT